MTILRMVKCDRCLIKDSNLTYNGEHWLPPKGWVEIYDAQSAVVTGEHLCPKCRPQGKKSKSSAKDNPRAK